MIVVIITLAISAICVGLVVTAADYLKRKGTNPTVSKPQVSFSAGSYLEEIEKVYLSILEEKEKEEPYEIILWWGLDGCRLNDAREVEWISRRKTPKYAPCIPCIPYNPSAVSYGWYNNCGYLQSQTCYSAERSISSLRNEINSNICQLQNKIAMAQLQQAKAPQFQEIQRGITIGRDMHGRIIKLES